MVAAHNTSPPRCWPQAVRMVLPLSGVTRPGAGRERVCSCFPGGLRGRALGLRLGARRVKTCRLQSAARQSETPGDGNRLNNGSERNEGHV